MSAKSIDDVFKTIVDRHTSMSISERSHGRFGSLPKTTKDLPLFTVFAETLGEVSDEQMALAREGL